MSEITERSPKPKEEPGLGFTIWQESLKNCPDCNMLVWSTGYFCCEACGQWDVHYQCGNCGWDEWNIEDS